MITGTPVCKIDTVLFDFGGVLAEEGYAKGLRAIAQRHGMNENDFFELARELIYSDRICDRPVGRSRHTGRRYATGRG